MSSISNALNFKKIMVLCHMQKGLTSHMYYLTISSHHNIVDEGYLRIMNRVCKLVLKLT